MAKVATRELSAKLIVRMPTTMKRFIEKQSAKSFTSQNAEIIRSIQERMERVQARENA